MRTQKQKVERPRHLKRKLMSALCMLLISTILLTATSYAWLVLSIAPEVTGITTNIGANGALEIALLNTETREDLSKIRTTFGGSLANSRVASSNTSWGNLIDLTVADYGLNELVLLPARLQYAKQDDGSYMVNAGLLSVPSYGYDGRIEALTNNTVSAVYTNNEFAYTVGTQDYGVRAIGTSDTLSVQASALATAKGNIASYTKSANSTAASAMNKNGPALMTIIMSYAGNREASFNDSNVDVIKTMVADLQKSVNYIDLALRYGLVAVAASGIADEEQFGMVQNLIMDTGKSLSGVVGELTSATGVAIPSGYSEWIGKAELAKGNLNAASNACDDLTGGSYTWDQIKEPLKYVMDMEKVYINDTPFSDVDSSMASDLMSNGAELTLPTGSGVFADVADFTGDYTAAFTSMVAVDVKTMTTVETPYLIVLSESVKDLEAPDGSGSGEQVAELTATYGYALDLAFRCNAAGTSNLLLQTAGIQRIYEDSSATSTMGGGSYMEFAANDTSITMEKMIQLMDAVRVAFVDDQGVLLKVAKLNTSNRSIEDSKVKAPLYFYEYSFSEEDGAMIMGERQKGDGLNVITALEQNTAKALTAVVWLDGDLVDNTMVSATEKTSLNGVLNLQFATDADLVPAGNDALKYATTDKTALNAAVAAAAETHALGQGTYTTVSWNAFVDAYTYAAAISESSDATEAQVYNATGNLALTTANLQQATRDALATKTNDVRNMMGLTTDVAAYVEYNEEKGTYVTVNPYTAEQKDNTIGTIYRVDYDYNLHDEGNDVCTPIYTDESWSALAAALYDAEAVNIASEKGKEVTEAQFDAAITALEAARGNLEHNVFYVPYEFEDVVYYYAIPRNGEAEEDTEDTYGRWYDNEFSRITSDLTILKLDTRATAAPVAAIEQSKYVSSLTSTIAPSVELYDEVYTALRDEEIKAVQWSIPENLFVRAITSEQITALGSLKTQAEALNDDDATDLQVPEALIAEAETAMDATGADMLTKSDADNLLSRLQAAVTAATPEEEEPEEEEPGTEPAPMTADQRTVLTAAVNAAKAVEGYDDAEKTELADLRTATAAVEALLALETGATEEAANTALGELNAKLKDLGEKEVNAYNTLQYPIPVGSELKEVVYAVETPHIKLKATGELGVGTVSAVVLTKSGIVFTASMDVEVYSPAAGVVIIEPNAIPVGGTMENVGTEEEPEFQWDRKIQAEETTKLSVELVNRQKEALDENGLIQKDEEGNTIYVDIPSTESVKKYTWASTDSEVLTVSDEESATCTVTAVKEGTARVTLSVTTVQGNTYTRNITLTVTAKPAAEEPDDPAGGGEPATP